jgi:hypothetical protein
VKSPQIRGLGYPGASGLLALIFKEWFGTVERPGTELSCCPKSKTIRDIAAWLKRKEEWKPRDAGFLIDIMRRKAVQPNEWFGTNEWLPRKIDMILWTFRNSGPCTTVQRTPDQARQDSV